MTLEEEENKSIKTYELHWLTSEVEIVEGTSIADAFRKAGYGAGALRALDYYRRVGEYSGE